MKYEETMLVLRYILFIQQFTSILNVECWISNSTTLNVEWMLCMRRSSRDKIVVYFSFYIFGYVCGSHVFTLVSTFAFFHSCSSLWVWRFPLLHIEYMEIYAYYWPICLFYITSTVYYRHDIRTIHVQYANAAYRLTKCKWFHLDFERWTISAIHLMLGW